MNLYAFNSLDLKSSVSQFPTKLMFTIEMVKPGDIEVLVTPKNIDVTELTRSQEHLFEEIFIVLLLPS